MSLFFIYIGSKCLNLSLQFELIFCFLSIWYIELNNGHSLSIKLGSNLHVSLNVIKWIETRPSRSNGAARNPSTVKWCHLGGTKCFFYTHLICRSILNSIDIFHLTQLTRPTAALKQPTDFHKPIICISWLHFLHFVVCAIYVLKQYFNVCHWKMSVFLGKNFYENSLYGKRYLSPKCLPHSRRQFWIIAHSFMPCA